VVGALKVDIIIPTYGRAKRQETLAHLQRAGLHPILVVQDREAHEYAHITAQKVILPPSITTIAPTRQYILESVGSHNKMVMLDDDLVFFVRRKDDPTKFHDARSQDIVDMFSLIDQWLMSYAHVGIAPREGGNRITSAVIHNTRIMRVLGYRRDCLLKNNVRFDRMEVMEDFHVALSLLQEGHENILINGYCNNQAGSGKGGGCSHFRTPELHAANARKLAELHPGFVRLVEKTTKTAWGGGTRTDVVISWKKAYDSSQTR
jgi:hypothetical protein